MEYSKIDQDHSSPSKEQFKIDSAMRIGYVSLNVSDINTSIDFYKSILGFKTVGRVSNERALLGVSGAGTSSYLVELLQVRAQDGTGASKVGRPEKDATRRRAGLYHFAILLPERRFLADMLQNLGGKRDQVYFDGLADYLVSESIYIRDPDFNGIEIYQDRPRFKWNWRRNHVEMATLPLNTADLLKECTEEGWREMPAKTIIGHVHLHVSDTAKARMFYQETMGLQTTASIPNALFFAANGYHHHVATNTWLGTDIAEAVSENIGLNHFSIELSNRDRYTRLLSQLADRRNVVLAKTDSDNSVIVHDADGIKIRLQCDALAL